MHTQRAARALARRFDTALRPLALTNGQFSILVALNREDPPPSGAVAALLGMDRTTLTANLKPLERRGLVRPHAEPTDRRVRRLALTPAGTELLLAAMPVWRREHRAVERMLAADPDPLRGALVALGGVALGGVAPTGDGPDRG
jgi:DNA-binding MarR family transcriptional regulator